MFFKQKKTIYTHTSYGLLILIMVVPVYFTLCLITFVKKEMKYLYENKKNIQL